MSFGIAGGLTRGLAPGTIVLGERIVSVDDHVTCHPGWLDTLASRLPKAARAVIFGSEKPVASAKDKAQLAASTGALVVDMESHIAARWAARHGMPFAAIRVVSDPGERSLPPAALVGMRADGSADILAVLRSLASTPRQLPSLLRTAVEAKRALDGLKHCRKVLGDDFCFFG